MMVHENLADDQKNWQNDGYNNVRATVVDAQQNENTICTYRVQFNLDETNFAETIAHNDQVYKDLGGGKTL